MVPYPGFLTSRPKFGRTMRTHRESSTSLREDQQVTGKRFAYCWVQDGLDLAGLAPFVKDCSPSMTDYCVSTPFSLHSYLDGASNVDCAAFQSEVDELFREPQGLDTTSTPPQPVEDALPAPLPGRRRLLQRFWDMGVRLGLVMSEERDGSALHVERTILITLQGLSISFMTVPQCLTLLARCLHWIPTEPLDYSLVDLPYPVIAKMRFLRNDDCGLALTILCFIWLALIRWAERNTCKRRTIAFKVVHSISEKVGRDLPTFPSKTLVCTSMESTFTSGSSQVDGSLSESSLGRTASFCEGFIC
jgi:hypothetical protein